MNFNDELHDDLFKLLILASNSNLPLVSYSIDDVLFFFKNSKWEHGLQYSDRSIAEEWHEGYVTDAIFAMLRSGMQPKLSATKNAIYNHKIRFQFVEDE